MDHITINITRKYILVIIIKILLKSFIIIYIGEIMNDHINEVSEGLDAALDTVKSLVKVLVIAYNDEITKLLTESIEKSQKIEKLESGDRY